jgi:opacity protein-like surface antigen
MNSFKALLLATACVAVMSTPALAAKAAAEAPAMDSGSMWTGPYVGIQLGAGTGTTEHTDLDNWFGGSKDFGTTDGAFIGGAKAGYDMADGNMIYGIFAEYSFSNIDTEQNVNIDSTYYRAGSDIKGLGSIRAKLGMASGDVAGFVSAGLAYQNADDKFTDTDGSDDGDINSNSDQWGWAFGLGTEYAVGGNGFIGLDASHYIFGTDTHEVIDAGVGQNAFFDFQNTVSTATVSYTYKFN